MHTVAFFHGFAKDAADAGMTDDEVENLVLFLSENPMAGKEIASTGGCRKIRIAGRGKGKSGGYRVITFYTGQCIPVFLVTVFSKGEQDSLSMSERNGLRAITKAIVSEYQRKVALLAKKEA